MTLYSQKYSFSLFQPFLLNNILLVKSFTKLEKTFLLSVTLYHDEKYIGHTLKLLGYFSFDKSEKNVIFSNKPNMLYINFHHNFMGNPMETFSIQIQVHKGILAQTPIKKTQNGTKSVKLIFSLFITETSLEYAKTFFHLLLYSSTTLKPLKGWTNV